MDLNNNFANGNFINGDGIPLGLGMALAQNNRAMEIFSGLNQTERQGIITEHTILTRKKKCGNLLIIWYK